MALALTDWGVAQLTAGGSQTTSCTKSGLNVTAGSLQVVMVLVDAVNNAGGVTQNVTVSITDTIGDTGGGSWTKTPVCERGTVNAGQYWEHASIWTRKIGTSPGSSKSITVTAVGTSNGQTVSNDAWMWCDFVEVTGQAASPIGASTGTTGRQATGSTTFTCTLGASPASSSLVFTCLHGDNTVTVATVPSGYTQLNESHPAYGETSASAYKNGSASSTAQWTGLDTASSYLGCALEIVAASSGTAISGSANVNSAGSGALQQRASTSAAGVASAASGTLQQRIAAAGGVASAGSGSFGATAITASGGVASAGALDLYVAGGLPSRFQGTQSFTRAVTIAGTQVHTLCCWVRVATTASIDANCIQLTNSTSTDTDSSRIGVVENVGVPSAVFVQHRTGVGSTAVLPPMSGSQWHHLALVIDGTNQVSYIDGTQVDSRAFNPALRTTGFTTIAIGQNFGGSTPDNAMQDAQVYTSALSAADIRIVMQGLIPAGSTLFARWMMQTGAPLQDISGNARVLTQVGTWAGASFAPLYGPPGAVASASTGNTLAPGGSTAISGSGAVQSAGSATAQNLVASSANVSSAGNGSLVNLVSATGAVQSAASASTQNLVAATGAIQSAASGALQSLVSASGGIASAGSGTAGEQVALAGTGAIQSAASATPQQLAAASGGVASASSGALDSITAIAASGGVQSAGSTSTQNLVSATGAVQSSASGAVVQLVSASGNVSSAGSGDFGSTPLSISAAAVQSAAAGALQNLATVSGGVASASSGTATESVALAASGGVQSAASASAANIVAASGDVHSSGSGTLQIGQATAADGGIQSAGTATVIQLFAATGGVASAASGTMSVTYLMTGTGGVQSAASGTLSGGTTPTATGGPFKGNVSRRQMYVGRRRMRVL
ncbi:MAG TPA: LamG-like jellyroll fold domain-containing protein [Vicinamibacterales bacterium]|nr:LamG-like jellyroll fold domain-containing protein [Vicinamibacterales bacterium]